MTKRHRTRKRAEGPADRNDARRSSAPSHTIDTHRVCLLLLLSTLLLKSLIFAPIGLWPLAFVCLVPWLIQVGRANVAPRVYLYSYLLGLAFYLINMRWLYPATGWGYLALSVYLAAYFPLMACPIRGMVRRRRWPFALVVPFVWVGAEMLRCVVISGFPWFFLSHSVYKVLTLIQISDLVGAYGVSFVVAAVNGATADVIMARLASTKQGGTNPFKRRARIGVAFAAAVTVSTCVYGQFQLHRDTISTGPRAAVLQGDYVNSVLGDEVSDDQKMRTYLSMMDDASKHKPDLFILPESPWIMYLNPEARDFFPAFRKSYAALSNRASRYDATIVTGSASLVRTPHDLLATQRRYNSATVIGPHGEEPKRYDKVHLVYFGEIVPFRFGRLRFLYFWLNKLMPFSNGGKFEYSLFPGTEFRAFTMNAESTPRKTYRFGIPICYEDVMPYVAREFAAGGQSTKRVDFLLNISNDGWFGRGVQQPQHLAICVFRAVENRVGIARAVNTGISGFIEPSGQLHDLVFGDPSTPWPGNCGYSVASIGVDSRFALYSRYGDWFAWACALVWLIFYVDYWILRARGDESVTAATA